MSLTNTGEPATKNNETTLRVHVSAVTVFGLSSSPNVSGPKSYRDFRETGPRPETFGEELKPKHRDGTYVVSLFFAYNAGCPVKDIA